ncbi:tetratricopeptide repeat protein [Chloroflexus sp. MS-CIW-1]|uniref:tetratricopeptide repeat protein n=1 Tax=Chloroflexus sp. MS-CIW-1 TaxID=3055768 RepID=UPI0026473BC5|nr:tetratricopeptide repeat protein [Chloroflexus sp. MS-CIW-1]MDN5271123.1 tetratricopeptide repeat protein [Chloroflexus sp. MS-CIW-1]
MTNQTILVNGKPFFGRVEEQKRFRDALSETINPPSGENLPYVFLVYGDGGIGKSTLSRRFCDIATEKHSLWCPIHTLWIDWEEARRRLPALQVGHDAIAPETVFDVIVHTAQTQHRGWQGYFTAYHETQQRRASAEHTAHQVLDSATERPELRELRSAGATALAKILRVGSSLAGLPIGNSGEQLAKAFLEAGIQIGAEAAVGLRQRLADLLRARMGADTYDLFVNPLEHLAHALADGLRRIAGRGALLVVLDTYEVVDAVDPWLRLVIRNSGPHVLWVLSGRNDLVNSRRYGDTYFKGYAEEWPRRLVPVNVTQLARDDVAAYFAATVPERPLDDAAVDAIRQTTRGIPLAIVLAAEMWQKGIALENIVGHSDKDTPAQQIVDQMTERYLLHAVTTADRYALYAIALARGDRAVLQGMLTPTDASGFNVNDELRRLERAYASVYAGEARLHDDPQAFFEAYLRQDAQLSDPSVQRLIERGVAVLEERLERIAADYDLIEERLTDDDYLTTTLALSDYLFWLDEERAWRWLIPRFVEALAYNDNLRRGLLTEAGRWRKRLSARGKRRLEALQTLTSLRDEAAATGLSELERLAERGYLAGDGEAERRAILRWQRGRLYYYQQRYSEAMTALDQAEQGLPAGGQVLRDHLAEAYEDLGGQLGWRRAAGRTVAQASPAAEDAYQKALRLGRVSSALYHALGAVQAKLKKYQQSLENFQKALEIDPENVYAWHGLGNVYADLRRYDEAIAAYRQALQLDPQFAAPWNGLGLVYTLQGELEQALQAWQKAVELAPTEGSCHASLASVLRRLGREEEARRAIETARPLMEHESEYSRACFAAICGDHEEALRLLQIALDQHQESRDWARLDPDFSSLHNDPRFWALVADREA